jgi:hypothetical protein
MGKSDLIEVKLKKMRKAWVAKCTEDGHVEMAGSSDAAVGKMRQHFIKKHPGKSPYVTV